MGWFRRNEHDEERLSAYVDGELSARQAENVERHVSSCSDCAALLEELRQTHALLSAMPSHAPRRSFVLGAEYAGAPARVEPQRRGFGLALAPAAALSIFVALIFVDVGGFSSSTSDDTSSELTAANMERDVDDAGVDTDATTMQAAGTGVDGQESSTSGGAGSAPQPEAASGEAGGAAAATGETPPSETRSSEPAVAPPAEEAPAVASDESAPDSAPAAEDLQAPADDDGDGISTLRLLQVLAGLAFLASALYVFVRPRLMRGS